MLNSQGYRKTQKVRLLGKTSLGSEFAVVLYDRDYVVCWIAHKIIRPLSNVGLIGLVSLIKEAYKETNPNATLGIDSNSNVS